MLDHLDDIDADFLAVYRIDLRDPATVLSAEVFFARVFRLFAYRGAMREELLAEQRNNDTPPPSPTAPSNPAPVAAPAAVGPSGEKWVHPDEMKTLFPDLF